MPLAAAAAAVYLVADGVVEILPYETSTCGEAVPLAAAAAATAPLLAAVVLLLMCVRLLLHLLLELQRSGGGSRDDGCGGICRQLVQLSCAVLRPLLIKEAIKTGLKFINQNCQATP